MRRSLDQSNGRSRSRAEREGAGAQSRTRRGDVRRGADEGAGVWRRAVGVITYKSTEEWIQRTATCRTWLKLMHHGDVTGTNALQNVRALFVVGRPLAPPRLSRGRPRRCSAPTSPSASTGRTRSRAHSDRARRSRQQHDRGRCLASIPTRWPSGCGGRCEAALIQAVGRARAGLRGRDEPLDIHLWTDVPLPELGPVEPVLWGELEAGLDG